MNRGWIDIKQNSPDWELLRIGRITCSQFSILFMKESTKGFQRFIREKAFERLTGEQILDKWQGNWTTEQGHERESEGIRLYEQETSRKVTPGGFWIYSDTIGGSPDGHCGDGLVEVKSRTTEVWLESIEDFSPSRAEFWQCMGQMLVSGKEWCDLVYTPPHRELKSVIYRIESDAVYLKELKEKLKYVDSLINEKQEKLKMYMK